MNIPCSSQFKNNCRDHIARLFRFQISSSLSISHAEATKTAAAIAARRLFISERLLLFYGLKLIIINTIRPLNKLILLKLTVIDSDVSM